MGKKDCGTSHKGHLCKLAADKKFGKIQKLSKNPRFICTKCGRVADFDDNLCKTKKFE